MYGLVRLPETRDWKAEAARHEAAEQERQTVAPAASESQTQQPLAAAAAGLQQAPTASLVEADRCALSICLLVMTQAELP